MKHKCKAWSMLAWIGLSSAAMAQAPTVGQYELLTKGTGFSLIKDEVSVAGQLGYQLSQPLYLALAASWRQNSATGTSQIGLAPLIEWQGVGPLGMAAGLQLNNDGLHWLRGRVFYRYDELVAYRLDYFAEYVHNENWQNAHLGIASKYYLASNVSLNADAFAQWAFDNSQGSPYVRPVVETGFSIFF